MVKDFQVTFLTLIGSSGFVLGLFGGVTTLWPHTPSKEGLAYFAFALLVAFVSFLANLLLFGSHLLIKNQDANSVSNRITNTFSVVIFFIGLLISCILFTEGMNAWFDEIPIMPNPLILVVRSLVLVPLFWFLLIFIFKIFKANKKNN